VNPVVARLSKLHDKAKREALSADERDEYKKLCDDLCRILLIAQDLGHQGKTLRAALRVASVLKVRLDFGGAQAITTSTIDLSEGGFAVVLDATQRVGHLVLFTLSLPALVGEGSHSINGTVRVASSRQQGSHFRVSFTFTDVSPDDHDYLGAIIMDMILARYSAKG